MHGHQMKSEKTPTCTHRPLSCHYAIVGCAKHTGTTTTLEQYATAATASHCSGQTMRQHLATPTSDVSRELQMLRWESTAKVEKQYGISLSGGVSGVHFQDALLCGQIGTS